MKGNGKKLDAFEQLEKLILRLGSGGNKIEKMARVRQAIRITKAIRDTTSRLGEHVGYLSDLLVTLSGGWAVQIPPGSMPPTTTGARVLDSNGEPVAMIDPMSMVVLIQPCHVAPFTIEAQLADGTIKKIPIEMPADPSAVTADAEVPS